MKNTIINILGVPFWSTKKSCFPLQSFVRSSQKYFHFNHSRKTVVILCTLLFLFSNNTVAQNITIQKLIGTWYETNQYYTPFFSIEKNKTVQMQFNNAKDCTTEMQNYTGKIKVLKHKNKTILQLFFPTFNKQKIQFKILEFYGNKLALLQEKTTKNQVITDTIQLERRDKSLNEILVGYWKITTKDAVFKQLLTDTILFSNYDINSTIIISNKKEKSEVIGNFYNNYITMYNEPICNCNRIVFTINNYNVNDKNNTISGNMYNHITQKNTSFYFQKIE